VSSPSISVASWSDLNAVYQENSAAALEVVNNVLNSPHNTWNYPSPGSPRLQYPPVSRTSSPVVPWSPTVASSPELQIEFVVPDFPFLEPTGPGPFDVYVPQSPQYSTSSASAGITLVDPDTLEPSPIDPNQYVVRSPPPPTPAPTLETLLVTAESDLAELDALLPSFNQDSWSHFQLTSNLVDHVSLEDIPLENIPPPILTAPVAALASPTPPSPAPLPAPVFYPTVDIGPFEYLFAAPPCLTTDGHPHQYTIHYEQGRHVWFSSEEFVNSKHPWSPKFPFGYIETTFLDSIKFVFSRFPPVWLTHFEGALVPLVAYDFLDGRTAILCGHLHFTEQGILFVNRSTCITDLLRTDPQFSCFVPTPRVPAKPFDFITPPSENPL